ncbi:MAG: M23 family metallopeptidase [Clostridiales bacterium]|nr:M23 family metallopeptidase [Clostridiales bacterium]
MYKHARKTQQLIIHTAQRAGQAPDSAAPPPDGTIQSSGAVQPNGATHSNGAARPDAAERPPLDWEQLIGPGGEIRMDAPPRRAARQRRQKPSAKWRKRARAEGRGVKRRGGEQLTAGERLMRNSAIACALLLMVLAMKNINQPWSEQATAGIRQAMTMQLDLDETLGRLQFVRALLPETALVFFNLDAERDLIAPVSGTVAHAYAAQQPWIQYECQPGQPVRAAAAGTVVTVGQGAQGDYIVSIDHQGGMQTVYAYLKSVSVAAGAEVESGQQLGVTGDEAPATLYFELREGGQSTDPTNRLAAAQ